jgi:hypothetical protein
MFEKAVFFVCFLLKDHRTILLVPKNSVDFYYGIGVAVLLCHIQVVFSYMHLLCDATCLSGVSPYCDWCHSLC